MSKCEVVDVTEYDAYCYECDTDMSHRKIVLRLETFYITFNTCLGCGSTGYEEKRVEEA